MSSLIRWRPAYELIPGGPLGRLWDLEDLFADFTRPFLMEVEPFRWVPRVESYQRNGSYVVKADLPGVDPKDVHVEVEGDHLTIRGERKMDKEIKRKDMSSREVFYGSFQRSMPIPKGLKVEELKAKYHDGVLEISAPMPKALLPKAVKIEVEKGN